MEHLEPTNFAAASAIIIPGADVAAGAAVDKDAATIKSILSVSTWARNFEALPVLVAEILDVKWKPVAEDAFAGHVETVAMDATASRLLFQNLRPPTLAGVFEELLSYNLGNELYIRDISEFEEEVLGGLAAMHPQAVPVGLLRGQRLQRRAWLNPAAHEKIRKDAWLVLMARSFAGARVVQRDAGPESLEEPRSGPLPRPPASFVEKRRILVIGWNAELPALAAELKRFQDESFELFALFTVSREQRKLALAGTLLPERMAVRLLEGDVSLLSAAHGDLLDACHNILLIAEGA